MSLEEAIRENTEAVKQLIERLHNPPLFITPDDTKEPVKRKLKTKSEIPVENVIEKTPIPQEKEEAIQIALPAVSYTEVKNITYALAKVSRETALNVLGQFNAKIATELKEDQWEKYIAAANQVLKAQKDTSVVE